MKASKITLEELVHQKKNSAEDDLKRKGKIWDQALKKEIWNGRNQWRKIYT